MSCRFSGLCVLLSWWEELLWVRALTAGDPEPGHVNKCATRSWWRKSCSGPCLWAPVGSPGSSLLLTQRLPLLLLFSVSALLPVLEMFLFL